MKSIPAHEIIDQVLDCRIEKPLYDSIMGYGTEFRIISNEDPIMLDLTTFTQFMCELMLLVPGEKIKEITDHIRIADKVFDRYTSSGVSFLRFDLKGLDLAKTISILAAYLKILDDSQTRAQWFRTHDKFGVKMNDEDFEISMHYFEVWADNQINLLLRYVYKDRKIEEIKKYIITHINQIYLTSGIRSLLYD